MATTQKVESDNFPTPEELCLRMPLYEKIDLRDDHDTETSLYQFITYGLNLDTFCPYCNQPTILIGSDQEIAGGKDNFRIYIQKLFEKSLVCSRDPSHNFWFIFHLRGSQLSKVGQSPSMADISRGQLNAYKGLLDSSNFQELNRAIGLASHGIGIGSYVYLRRIFERLVEEAHQKAVGDESWVEGDFEKSRMDQKILLLRDYLPELLVQERSIYGVLSMGLHSMDENSCLSFFPVMRTGIELILDQRLAMDEQRKKISSLTVELNSIRRHLDESKTQASIKTNLETPPNSPRLRPPAPGSPPQAR